MSKHGPKVTVYITSYNYDKYLQEAIESVFNQVFRDWELLLINDGSTDRTQKIMEKYKDERRIRIFNTGNIGLQKVANFVIRNSRGDYIIRLDADDIFDKHILFVLSHHLNENKDVALVFPDYYLIDDQKGIIMHEIRNPIAGNKKLLDMPAHGACTMVRKSVLKSIGGYREDLAAQDGLDIWTRITKKYKCLNINLPLFYYRKHGENMTHDTLRIIDARRNIKKIEVVDKINNSRPIISVIPCRRNYDIELDLWKRKINDRPLLDYLIEASSTSHLFDKIVITSDNPETEKLIRKYDDPRLAFVLRNKKLTAPAASLSETLRLITSHFDPKRRGISVLSYIQAPFTSVSNLEEAVHTLLLNDAESAISAEEIESNLFRRSKDGLVKIYEHGKIRTDFDIIYGETRTSAAIRNSNLNGDKLFGKRTVHFTVPKHETFFIKSKHDLDIANHLSKLLKK